MSLSLKWQPLADLDEAAIASWSELARKAEKPNPFSAPEFVLPAARWLTPEHTPWIASIYRSGELIGVGCFTPERANLFIPVPHLRSYRCAHSFRSGLLHLPGESVAVAEALLRFLHNDKPRRHALAFHNVMADCLVMEAMRRQLRTTGGRWFERHRFHRPVLRLNTRQEVVKRLPSAVVKDLRRRHRRLQGRGETTFRILQGPQANGRATQTHLELEHDGWKGDAGSSMLSSQAHTRFFQEMMERFRQTGGAVFAEILCGGEVIASSSNLLLGGTLNGFKTGWHHGYAAASPGRLNELLLFEQMPTLWPHANTFDSQAQQDSYLANMLPDRETMLTGVLTTTQLGSHAMTAARFLRPLAYRLERDAS
ncbi:MULTISPECIES: GNAT family N-acetyltransferase [unclassified Pseudoxanthomonas]|uniref:GNAT family N-acetyltransferase n=1 Tax=unclassified Pseudoxanthomonas TaxID=2645906 RepID=UPI003076CBBA